MIAKPNQEAVSSTSTSDSSVLFDALSHAATVNVIEDEERVLSFAAAGTGPAVGMDCGGAKVYVPVSPVLVAFDPVFLSVCTDLVNAVAVVLALLPPYAFLTGGHKLPFSDVVLILWFLLSTPGTLLHMTNPTSGRSMDNSVKNRAWLQNFTVISSTYMQCILCETGVPVGMGVWNSDSKSFGWTEGPWDLSTFQACATSHLFECPQWLEGTVAALRNHPE